MNAWTQTSHVAKNKWKNILKEKKTFELSF